MIECVGHGETGKKCDLKESSFVWDLPVDAHVVALVHDSKETSHLDFLAQINMDQQMINQKI